MFKEEVIEKVNNKPKKTLEAKIPRTLNDKISKTSKQEIPEDPFKGESPPLVVYNGFGKFGDKNDKLMWITSRKYGQIKPGSSKEKWLYAGVLFEMKEVNSEGLPKIPYESHLVDDVSEDNLTTRTELLSF